MAEHMQIRSVNVELLRSGPAHNQLLSPLTLYLGICDEAEAGIVTLPFEHHTFVRRMNAMRYGDHAKPDEKLPELRAMGVEMAKVLGTIPRLAGSLTGDASGRDTLVHLSLVLSASELASLPFELAKMPIGPTAWTESWLALQSRVPVVMTRRTRNVAPRSLRWLAEPRLLFISSDPDSDIPDNVPFKEHREALLEAMWPFMSPDDLKGGRCHRRSTTPGGCQRQQWGEVMTVLARPRFEDVVAECTRHRYTMIHVLAHGALDATHGDRSSGLLLHPDDGVISGERLATAFGCLVGGAIHRPDVVTLSTCDSGKVEDVVAPGAGIAHALHQSGIPLVVASQFPLSKAGSVLATQQFYGGLLWGEHPWTVLHRVRSTLHGRLNPRDHDWASVVVYESLPAESELVYKLDHARFSQCERALLATWLRGAHSHPRSQAWSVERVLDRLPVDSKYVAMQALALKADGLLLQAKDDFLYDTGACEGEPPPDAAACERAVMESCSQLEEVLAIYRSAVEGFLVNEGQGMNAPYRALVAQLRLAVVLGQVWPPGGWPMARYWIDTTLARVTDREERLWAWGCLAELWLLALLDPAADRPACRVQALAAATEMQRLDRTVSSKAQQWSLMQFMSYLDWWGDPRFEQALARFGETRRQRFGAGDVSVLGVAQELIDVLDKQGARARLAQPPGDDDAATETVPDAGSPPASPVESVAASSPDRRPGAVAPPAVAAPSAPRRRARAATPSPAGGSPPPAAPAPAATPAPATASPLAAPGLLAAGRGGKAYLHVDMLPGGHGDALWIEYGRDGGPASRLLVDCGTMAGWRAIRPRLEALAPADRQFELFILSHVDADHIGGAIPLLKELPALGLRFGDVWFNGYRHLASQHLGAKQGEIFSALIQDLKLPWNRWRKGAAIVRDGTALPAATLPGGMKLTLLSPTPPVLAAMADEWEEAIRDKGFEPGSIDDAHRMMAGRSMPTSEDVAELAASRFVPDGAKPNGSSIAVLAEFEGKSVLLGADAHVPVLAEALDRLARQRKVAKLVVDAFKLPHHASAKNVSSGLLQKLDCRNYLVSTNGDQFGHPDREAIARVLAHGGPQPKLWFNYRSAYNEVWAKPALQKKYGYTAVFPADGQQGLQIRL